MGNRKQYILEMRKQIMRTEDLAKIKEKMADRSKVLKPAIAGLIVDNKVDRKEVFATFVQLTVSGNVLVVPYRKFVRIKKPGLSKFEAFVLDAVFLDKEKVDEKTVIERLKSVDLARFSMFMLDELIEQGIADKRCKLRASSDSGSVEASSYLDISEDGSRISRKKEVMTTQVYGGSRGGILDRIKGAFGFKVKPRSFDSDSEMMREMESRMNKGTVKSTGMRMTVNGVEVTDPAEIESYRKKFGPEFATLMEKAKSQGKTGMMDESRMPRAFDEVIPPANVGGAVSGFEFIHTPKADMLMNEYLELQDFLRRFPVYEDRFSNEFVGFNIAFHLRGTDKLPG